MSRRHNGRKNESSMNLEFNVVLAGKQADWTDNKTDAHADEATNLTMKAIKLSAYEVDQIVLVTNITPS